jgi:DNA-binding response OmpR family regulator
MKAKVLIIEDDREIVESVSLCFRIYWPEAEVIAAYRGIKGIEMAQSESPDTIILDLGLPDINGFEVLKQIRLFSSVPTIILTVRSQEEDVVRALDEEANDYVVKPFRQKELLARVRAQLSNWMTNQVRAALR